MPKKKTAAVRPAKLDIWQQRLADSDVAWKPEMERMDHREHLYNGDRKLRPLVRGDEKKDGTPENTPHVRNIIFENIESQVSSSIPAPKVTPRRREDEKLAEKIEHFLRCELDRLPFETINDQAERTVPIQGGVGFLVAWDNRKRTHDTVGEEEVAMLHPKQFAPQPGIYTCIQDMDWFIVRQPTTKERIRRQYGVNVENEGEQEPQVRGTGDEDTAEDAVTMYIGYAKNDQGGIDRYVWVNDIELEDLKNYQARRVPVCAHCGRVRPLPGQIIQNRPALAAEVEQDAAAAEVRRQIAGRALAMQLAQDVAGGLEGGLDAMAAEDAAAGADEPQERYDGGPCPWCGSTEFSTKEQDYEEVILPITTSAGLVIPGEHPEIDETGRAVTRPTKIPFYRPDVFPVVLQKSVSVYGQLLGNSDVDVIKDQQNTINRMEKKIIDRLVKAGTRITLPSKATLRTDPEDGERWYLDSPADKAMIDVYQFSGDLQYELTYLATVYEEARQILGITDSFQGRTDPTATSGKAKEFSAAQAAGRLESKRTMKQAAYAQLFELMFKFWLAYSDEPRPISYKDNEGNTVYEEISRYDFLKQDEDGQFYWDDQFLFSCDTSAPLASNREAMWQETRMNLQTGAFGAPESTEALILFWSKMEELHYETWKDSFSISKEMIEDSKLMDLRKQPAAFMTSYHRTRELFGAALYGGAIKAASTVQFKGKTFDITTADGQPLFSTAHPAKVSGPAQCNLFKDAFSVDALGQMETAMQIFCGDTEEILDVSPDTILIPDLASLKKDVFAAIGADKDPATANNAFNYQFGRWTVICWPYLNKFITAGTAPWILLDSKYNEQYGGAVWNDRIPLAVRSTIDENTDANVWRGRSRWNATFNDWRFAAIGGISTGEDLPD